MGLIIDLSFNLIEFVTLDRFCGRDFFKRCLISLLVQRVQAAIQGAVNAAAANGDGQLPIQVHLHFHAPITINLSDRPALSNRGSTPALSYRGM